MLKYWNNSQMFWKPILRTFLVLASCVREFRFRLSLKWRCPTLKILNNLSTKWRVIQRKLENGTLDMEATWMWNTSLRRKEWGFWVRQICLNIQKTKQFTKWLWWSGSWVGLNWHLKFQRSAQFLCSLSHNPSRSRQKRVEWSKSVSTQTHCQVTNHQNQPVEIF